MPKLTKFEQIFMKFATFLQILWITDNFLGFPAILTKFREILSENHRVFAKFSQSLQTSRIFTDFSKHFAFFQFEAVQRLLNLVD